MRELVVRREKTLIISCSTEEGVIKRIKISGDFFAFPEDSIDKLEKELIGKEVSDVEKVVRGSLEGCVLVGISLEDIVEALRRVIQPP